MDVFDRFVYKREVVNMIDDLPDMTDDLKIALAVKVAKLPAADVAPVVRCKDCKHGILDGVEWWQCCKDADYDEEARTWHGFISHNEADWFCADGQRRENK